MLLAYRYLPLSTVVGTALGNACSPPIHIVRCNVLLISLLMSETTSVYVPGFALGFAVRTC